MYKVDGFLFEDEALAVQARKEEEGIRFIKEKSPLNNPETVLKLYKTLLQQKLFVTPVGLRFLMELETMLRESPQIAKEDIPSIDADVFAKPILEEETPADRIARIRAQKAAERANKRKEPIDDYKQAFHVALFFAIVFGLSVLGMFVITEVSGNNVNILNYREQIINQYEHWEQELESEQERLEAWEEELQEREEALKSTQN